MQMTSPAPLLLLSPGVHAGTRARSRIPLAQRETRLLCGSSDAGPRLSTETRFKACFHLPNGQFSLMMIKSRNLVQEFTGLARLELITVTTATAFTKYLKHKSPFANNERGYLFIYLCNEAG